MTDVAVTMDLYPQPAPGQPKPWAFPAPDRGVLANGLTVLRCHRPGQEVVGHLRLFTRRALEEFLTARGFACERICGAPYHDVPRPLRPLDRWLCHWPSAASILLVQARRS